MHKCPKCDAVIEEQRADEIAVKFLFADSRTYEGGKCDVCGYEKKE